MLQATSTAPTYNLLSPFRWQFCIATYCFVCMEVLNKILLNKWTQIFNLPIVHAFTSQAPLLPLSKANCFNSSLHTHSQGLLLFSRSSGSLSKMLPFYPFKLTYSPLLILLTIPLLQTRFPPVDVVPLIGERCFRLSSWVLSPVTTSCSPPHFSVQSRPGRGLRTA